MTEVKQQNAEDRCRSCEHCVRGQGACIQTSGPLCLASPVDAGKDHFGRVYRSIYVVDDCPVEAALNSLALKRARRKKS